MNKIERPRSLPSTILITALTFLTLMFMTGQVNQVQGQWATNGNDIYNTNTGNVGIGTSNPQHTLTVEKNYDGPTGVITYNTADGPSANLGFGISRTLDFSNKYFSMGVTAPSFSSPRFPGLADTAYLHSSGFPIKIGTQSAHDIYFFTNGNANTKLTIASGGNVGVGTNNPGYKLDVAGAVNATAFYLNGTPFSTAGLASGTGTTNKVVKWTNGASGVIGDSTIFDNGSGVGVGTTNLSDFIAAGDVKFKVVDGPMTLAFRDFATGQGYLAIGSTNGISGFIGHTNVSDGFTLGTFSTHKLTFRTGSTNRMTIDTAGNVGIGTTTPQSTLQVNGYVQLALTSGAPPAADCDDSSEHGRMKVDATNNKLYVCTSTGWKTAALTP